MFMWNFYQKWQWGTFDLSSFDLGIVAKATRVVGGSPVSMGVAFFAEEVMCMGL